jgi:hypothetical protein
MSIPAGNGSYSFVNRLSGLCLDEPNRAFGTQLDQSLYTGGANQQFSLNLFASTPTAIPVISSISVSVTNAVLSGTNGAPDWPYIVLTSSNLTSSAGAWTIASTNAFDNSGSFISTNPVNPGLPQLFYRLQLQ